MAIVPQQRTSDRTLTGRQVPASPASLTQAGPTPYGTCPECASVRVTALGMTLTDGTPVTFVSCHSCEHRHWSHEGTSLAFADVIARATKQKV